ncbi:zinc finger CCCH domain-containing protein 11A-like [Macrobrachium rosenbergii]|uniref:zinc finger CCCH domain-containing protein 11A-like n=1 Tax=Macrobrachium rosenbergii TaxID=79674 RepID=UPI0034D690DF
MEDKPAPVAAAKNTKNNDCYFYYYSSCSKGDACPFRHEPAALRNETVCIFWLQGNCSKKNCIFRHMELTKQRDKIACWFETQPGGCKKPHCPFQHQNILDHPREEDIKKKPDLILPVKKEENSRVDIQVGNGEEPERQIVFSKNEAGSVTPPRQAHFAPIPRNPIIVPLQDGESDSESVSGSPYKRVNPELSAQLEWELRKLRQIQAHEADIIGYVFTDDMEEDGEEEDRFAEESLPQNQELEEYVVEEILEVEEEPDAIHRRLHPIQRTIPHAAQANAYSDAVLGEHRKGVLKPQGDDLKVRRKVQISERLGGVASRALAETLGTNVQLRQHGVKRLSGPKEEEVNTKSIAERLGKSPNKKLSLLDRLGTRQGMDSSRALRAEDNETEVVDKSIANKITAIRSLHGGGEIDTVPDCSSVTKTGVSKTKEAGLDFTIKSLADIKAEKQRKVIVRTAKPNGEKKQIQSRLGIKNGTKLHMGDNKPVNSPGEEGSLKVLSLSEIKARQMSSYRSNSNSSQSRKRPISPISFEEPKKKLVSNSNSLPVQQKKRSVSPISFNTASTTKRVLKKNTSAEQQKKRSISPISFQADDSATRKIRVSSSNCDSVQSKTPEAKSSPLGVRKITINRSPAKKSPGAVPLGNTVLNKEHQQKEADARSVNSKLLVQDVQSKNKINNNNVTSESTKPEQHLKDSGDKSLNVSVSRMDSFLEDEEALLLGGEMTDDEEDIDEAALLL